MRNRLTHGNIKDRQLDNVLEKYYPDGVDICYTDPPWGNSNLNYWKTMNKKKNGVDTNQLTQEQLESRIVGMIIKHVKKYAFIVYGVKQAESLKNKFLAYENVIGVQIISKKYQSGSKWLENVVIVVILNNEKLIDWEPLLKDQNGLKGLEVVCKFFKGKIQTVLEMFIGVGYYLKVLDKYGYEVVGNELSKARLLQAIKKIT